MCVNSSANTLNSSEKFWLKNIVVFSLVCFLAVFVSGCSQFQLGESVGYQLPPADHQTFGPPPSLPSTKQLTQLTQQQEQEFLAYFNDYRRADVHADLRIFNYIEHFVSQFTYHADTYSATQALAQRSGNCLSLALLTTALADIADVEIRYDLVDSTPVFDQVESVITRGLHVRSKLYRPVSEETMLNLGSQGTVIDYFPSGGARFLGGISRVNFLASYYNNIAVDFLEAGNLNSAYWYGREALRLDSDNGRYLNTLAVIYRRAGQPQVAENLYRQALEVNNDQLLVLKNYRTLLLTENRVEEAAKLTQAIDTIDDPSPYGWMSLADDAYQRGQYRGAIKYYQKAVDMAPYLQYGYLGLAKSWYQLGNAKRTQEMLLKARENNFNSHNEQLYKAKLAALAAEQTVKRFD